MTSFPRSRSRPPLRNKCADGIYIAILANAAIDDDGGAFCLRKDLDASGSATPPSRGRRHIRRAAARPSSPSPVANGLRARPALVNVTPSAIGRFSSAGRKGERGVDVDHWR